MEVAIVQYNAGNTQSVINALNRLGIEPLLTRDPEELQRADKVIFPGVGEAGSTMKHLGEFGLTDLLPTLKQPFLGICLGMQLMCRHSEESDTTCLGIFDLEVSAFKPDGGEKVPHMGWNNIIPVEENRLFTGMDDLHVYFVHSFYVPENMWNIATAQYIQPFSAAIHRDNFYAVQFHPEKSGPQGQKILENFIEL